MSFISQSTRESGIVGRLFSSLFFPVFACVGLFFCYLLARDFYQNIQTYSWTPTPCTILESKVEYQHAQYLFPVKYQYDWQGKIYTSDKYSRRAKGFSDYTDARRLVERFKSDSRSFCFVNEANPTEAILVRPSLWSALAIFFPLIFVAVGVGGIWRGKKITGALTASGPLSTSSGGRWRSPLLACFFLSFFLAGCVAAWTLAIRPFLNILAAKLWQPAPCTILSSRVQSHSGSKGGRTCSIEILYAYQFNGQELRSSRYHFLTGASSGYESKAAVVRRYPPGTKTTCFVNPNDPLEAVLDRGFSSGMWLGILFPIPFLAVGAGGLVYVWRKARSQNATCPKLNPKWGDELIRFPIKRSSTAAGRKLHPRVSRWMDFLGSIAIAAFWNGILSIFLVQVIGSWRRHHPEWFLTIFLIPFVAVGLGMIGYVGYCFLALFNPAIEVSLDSAEVRLGDTLQLRWNIRGRAARIRNLRISLEGREEVSCESTSGRSNSKAVEKSRFATYPLANISSRPEIRSGSAKVQIPLHSMHSFTSANNRIIWAIQVHGEIPHWPDIKYEYPVQIGPLAPDRLSRL